MPSIEQGTSDSMSYVPRDLAIEPVDDRAPLEKGHWCREAWAILMAYI